MYKKISQGHIIKNGKVNWQVENVKMLTISHNIQNLKS